MEKQTMGWHRDLPDIRDYTINLSKTNSFILDNKNTTKHIHCTPFEVALPSKTDLRPFFTEIETQEGIGSCCAQAGVGLMEYFIRQTTGKSRNLSRLFLYKTIRNLMIGNDAPHGDIGGFLRTTMGAMAIFGVPPEEYWRYDTSKYDIEPSKMVYSLAQKNTVKEYYRIDKPGIQKTDLLVILKRLLVCGMPSMFGTSIYSSINYGVKGSIPYPKVSDNLIGGHALICCGMDDDYLVEDTRGNNNSTGAFIIRNSWGNWGDNGYGYLPYKYVLDGLAVDFWTIFNMDWMDLFPFIP